MSKKTSHLLTWIGVALIVVAVIALIVKAIELILALILLAIGIPLAIAGVRKLRHHAHHQVTDERK
ncbi:hypothetical protein [Parvularcula dongshanensis]|uniref:Uncharacterized protein n=1 Tax=Parvularcula dongshanensis TaxID=1173995 RepID=A0A840I104_9PROT|nr:hypothetical protein [Parvularcula dongshanensis]MBB4658509.1 hypothetical protein [Parvularcula dongshanensis]